MEGKNVNYFLIGMDNDIIKYSEDINNTLTDITDSLSTISTTGYITIAEVMTIIIAGIITLLINKMKHRRLSTNNQTENRVN